MVHSSGMPLIPSNVLKLIQYRIIFVVAIFATVSPIAWVGGVAKSFH